MSLSRDELVRRVETARRWLEQAEHSFHDETPLKGELNLLLAQAEMQKLREDRGMSRQWQHWQRALALVTAIVMVSGFSWWWQKGDDAPAPVTAGSACGAVTGQNGNGNAGSDTCSGRNAVGGQ